MMKTGNNRELRKALLSKARHLLEQCGVQRPPVNLIRIARHVGIQRIRELDVRLDGQLFELDDGSYEVILSSQSPHTRRRFTLAHEIGHILVAAQGGELVCSDGPTEELCNAVAAELLLPEQLLAASLCERIDVTALKQIAANFQCSLEATGWRLLNMERIKGALLICRDRGDSSLEVTAVPRTYGFRAPFEMGDIVGCTSALMKQVVAGGDSGSIQFVERRSGRSYKGTYTKLTKTVLMFLEGVERAAVKARKMPARDRAQGELFEQDGRT